MNSQLLAKIEGPQLKKVPEIRPGDLVRVNQKIKEGKKERIQVFEGVVLRVKGGGLRKSFIVRKISFGIGVERSFPIHSPNIEKIEIKKRAKVRRAYLTYLRSLTGKKARLKDEQFDSLVVNVQPEIEEDPSTPEATKDKDELKEEGKEVSGDVSEESMISKEVSETPKEKNDNKDAELTELDADKIAAAEIEEVPLSEVQKEEIAAAEAEDEIKEGLDDDDHQKIQIEAIEEGVEEAEKDIQKGKNKETDSAEKTEEDITSEEIAEEIKEEKEAL